MFEFAISFYLKSTFNLRTLFFMTIFRSKFYDEDSPEIYQYESDFLVQLLFSA